MFAVLKREFRSYFQNVVGWLFGKSNEAIIVEFMGDRSLIGTFVSVQITESKNWAVSGRLLDDERKEAVQK